MISMILHNLFGYCVKLFLVIGPIIGYIPQYKLIKSTGILGSFSTKVCFILLVCNILRLLSWFSNPFDTCLLLQSIFTITFQLTLLHLCVTALNRSLPLSTKQFDKKESKFGLNNFWEWTEYRSYIIFLTMFASAMTLLTFTFRHATLFNQAIGAISGIMEGCLGWPQFLKNMEQKSVKGLSIMMVAFWFFGDVCKTYFFYSEHQPFQFCILGLLQVITDLAILAQVKYYQIKEEGYEKV